jgi:hypothetical protein
MATDTRKFKQAIIPILQEYIYDLPSYGGGGKDHPLVVRLTSEHMRLKHGALYNQDAEKRIEETQDMIDEVEKALGVVDAIDLGGNGKWEKAIRYLIKMKKDKGWEFKVLWAFVNSEEMTYEAGRLSYGKLMKDPYNELKAWMPRAHATSKKEVEIDTGGGAYV